MGKTIKKIIIPLIALTILNASACNVNTEDNAVNLWMDARSQAIISGDVDAFMQTVNKDNYYLYNEEFNLISSIDAGQLDSISLNAALVDDTEDYAVYRISQKYIYNEDTYECSYNAGFIKDNGSLFYDGIDAQMLKSGGVTVYFPKGYDDSAKKYASAVTYYLDKLNEIYYYTPNPGICIKIYDNHDVFLQSVKFDLPKWVGGWHEYGESVKIYAPNKSADISPATVYHECSHRFLSEIANDNASYWLQEGFATLMEDAIPTGLANIDFLYNNDIKNLNSQNSLWRFDEFTGVNLEELSDPVQVTGYYALSALCVQYIIDIAGIGDFLSAISQLSQNPQIYVTASEKIDTTNELTIQCFSDLLNVTEDEFYGLIDNYIDTYR